jgi:adenylosuccinate synthase
VLDRASEDQAREKIGTTGRGIGPAYEEKVGRRGIRVADATDAERFSELIQAGVERTVARLKAMGCEDDGTLKDQMRQSLALRDRLLGLATDVGREVDELLSVSRRILLEGAQGTALDLDHGTYPFVTSSNTTAAGAAIGIGIGPTRIDSVLGVVKAYTTRVGNGPLPTEFGPEMDAQVRELGGEFGATTGRPRRCGWFDAVLARHASRVNGLTGLAVTKIDVLDTLPEISVGIRYRMPGGETEHFPSDTHDLGKAQPVFETHPGWERSTSGARCLDDLPLNARRYLDRIEELVDAPIEMVSVGTRRSQVIHPG